MATHEVRVDYARSLGEQPETGHNRWHPDIAPVATCDPGDEVVLDTRTPSTARWDRRRPWTRWPPPT